MRTLAKYDFIRSDTFYLNLIAKISGKPKPWEGKYARYTTVTEQFAHFGFFSFGRQIQKHFSSRAVKH